MRFEVWATPRDVLAGLQKSLIVAQAGLSVVLLASAWLLTQSLRNMRGQNFGFETSSRYILHIDPQMAGYKPAQMRSLYRELHDSLAAIPGVSSVSFSLYTPMENDNWSEFVYIEGQDTASSYTQSKRSFLASCQRRIFRNSWHQNPSRAIFQ